MGRMSSECFEPGHLYEHLRRGRPSGGGVFLVACVGRAPAAFEDPSEARGVAFGWRRGISREGIPQLGSYSSGRSSRRTANLTVRQLFAGHHHL
ncbi:hypothetical protein GCM10010441_07680 [Kitasatospora paracochleata]